jgi:large subunit ribosomal protein L25
MDDLTLQAGKRNVLGKKTRFLRRQGVTPVHIFGHGVESQALQCDTAQLKKIIAHAGMTRLISLKIDGDKEPKNVFVREIQRNTLSKQLLHIDFYQVKKGEKITVDIPIVLVGEAPAMKGKGRILTHGLTSINVECLPENVPPRIEVDISPLKELEQAIQVKDIALGPDITVNADPDQLVVKVSEVIIKEVVEEVVAAPEAEAAPAAEAEAEAKAEGEAGQPKAEPPSEQK